MRKSEKQLQSIIPGTGTGIHVQDGEIHHAIKQFKKTLKESGKFEDVFNKRYYTKPSVARKKQLDNAKYIQKIRSDEEKQGIFRNDK